MSKQAYQVHDMGDEYAKVLRGEPPENFAKLCADAMQMHLVASRLFPKLNGESDEAASDRIRDVYLICAFSLAATRPTVVDRAETRHGNPYAIVERLRQIVYWCRREKPPQSPVDTLERQAREVARAISMRLFEGQGFLTILFDQQGDHAHPESLFSWASSIGRNAAIVLTEKVARIMRDSQADKS